MKIELNEKEILLLVEVLEDMLNNYEKFMEGKK